MDSQIVPIPVLRYKRGIRGIKPVVAPMSKLIDCTPVEQPAIPKSVGYQQVSTEIPATQMSAVTKMFHVEQIMSAFFGNVKLRADVTEIEAAPVIAPIPIYGCETRPASMGNFFGEYEIEHAPLTQISRKDSDQWKKNRKPRQWSR